MIHALATVFSSQGVFHVQRTGSSDVQGPSSVNHLTSSFSQASSIVEISAEGYHKCEECEDTKKRKQVENGPNDLSESEKAQVQKLKARDSEVKRHEQAHLAAAGPYAKGGVHYSYQSGPDGKQYAIGGHVNIDTGKIPNDPEATIRKAQVIQRAALAPEEPSSQDKAVASQAVQMEMKARQELADLHQEKRDETSLNPTIKNASIRADSTNSNTNMHRNSYFASSRQATLIQTYQQKPIEKGNLLQAFG